MSLHCPYRHVSYATWHLKLLRRLCLYPDKPQPRDTLKSEPKAKSIQPRRHYSLFRPFAKSKTERESSSQDGVPAETAAGAPRSQPPQRRKAFNPYSEEALQRMKELLPELKALSEKMRDEQSDDGHTPSRGQVSIPESPVKIHVEKAAKRWEIQKERATYKEVGPLKNNPWAEMLASPIRFCQASGARLPGDFLVGFDYVKNPLDGKTYLLPADIADLDALEKRMAKELYSEDWRRARDDKRAARNRREEEGTVSSAPPADTKSVEDPSESNHPVNSQSPARRHAASSRMLPDVNIFRLLTLQLTKGKKNKPQTRVTKAGEVAKLIPFESKEPVLSAQHYVRHKKEVELATGVADSQTPTQLPFSFKELQWQPDIHVRLAQIMRKRILLCLKALAESSKEESACNRRARVVALPVPQSKKLKSVELLPFRTDTLRQEKGSSEASRSGEGREDVRFLSEETTNSSAEAMSTTFSQFPAMSGKGFLLGHPDITPGTTFLHIGYGNISSLLSQHMTPNTDTDMTHPSSYSSPFSPSSLPPLPSHNLIPPMLTVDDTYRYPVFSLHQLLADPTSSSSSNDAAALDTLLQDTTAFRSPLPEDESDYLLLIRPGPGPAKQLVKEVWQLWRFVEGQPGVSLETDWSLQGKELVSPEKQGEDEDDSGPKDKRKRRDVDV